MSSNTLPCVEIEKSDISRIRVARSQYGGHEFIDRTFVKNDAGDYIPTKKGVTISPEQLDALIHALRRIQSEGGTRE